MKSSKRAFTLVELIIVVLILAVLTVMIAARFSRAALGAKFDNQVKDIVRILEEARAYSLGSTLIDDIEPVEQYVVTIGSTTITLDAQGETLVDTLETLQLESGYTLTNISPSDHIFYFTPNGEICMETTSCDSGYTETSMTLTDSSNTYSQEITVNIYGGYPELVD